MKKFILFLSLFVFAANAQAAIVAQGNPDVYRVTVKAVQFQRATGEWITVAAPYQTVDIASASAGETVASMLSDGVIPVGEYINFRVVISESFQIAGSVSGYSTLTDGELTLAGADGNAGSTTTWGGGLPNVTPTIVADNLHAGAAGEMTVTLDLANDADTDIFIQGDGGLSVDQAVVINGDSVVNISFTFDTVGTLLVEDNDGTIDNGGAGEFMLFAPPALGTSIEFVVDGRTVDVDAVDMRMDF